MSIVQGPTDSFSLELLKRIHDLENDTFMLALYGSSASLGPETTAYTSTGEVTGSGYSAGGVSLGSATLAQSNGVAYADWADATWTAPSITAASGALIYNATRSNKSVWVLNFGIERLANPNFTVSFPLAGYDTAIIRVGARR